MTKEISIRLKALNKKDKINFIKILKIAIGSSAAILFAGLLGLQYSASAGIITLLSIQDTKKETLIIAGKRLLAFLMAIVTAYFLFSSFGYHTITFGVFLLVFITESYLFRLPEGIAMCSVLVTHFLIEKNMGSVLIRNEIMIMITGTFVGILLNLYMPGNTEAVKADMRLIEEDMKIILGKISEGILSKREQIKTDKNYDCKSICKPDKELTDLDNHLKGALSRAYDNMNNTLLSDTRYYIQYFMMRKNQFSILIHINEQLGLLTSIPKQAVPIALFLNNIGKQFHEYNNAEKLLEELDRIKSGFREEPNPLTREEFENRAVLYLVLYDLETFLKIKRNFVSNISLSQIITFWKAED
ncbi:MAG: aromatic acid exporter family protein [Anaerocolumna sp.]